MLALPACLRQRLRLSLPLSLWPRQDYDTDDHLRQQAATLALPGCVRPACLSATLALPGCVGPAYLSARASACLCFCFYLFNVGARMICECEFGVQFCSGMYLDRYLYILRTSNSKLDSVESHLLFKARKHV